MQASTLSASSRTEMGRKTRTGDHGNIPAVLYGHAVENRNLWVDRTAFNRIFTEVGESSIIDLVIDKEKEPASVIIRDIQRHPLSHEVIHVDFYQIKRGEEMTADVAIHLTGESPAVKNMGGTLMQSIDTVEVKCLPKDLPQEIVVDVSVLVDFDSHISVADLSLPEGVACLADDSVVIVSVSAPRVEKETASEEVSASEETEASEESAESEEKKEE